MRTNLLRTLLLLSCGLAGFAAEPNRLPGGVPKRIVMIIGENEFLPIPAKLELLSQHLKKRGF